MHHTVILVQCVAFRSGTKNSYNTVLQYSYVHRTETRRGKRDNSSKKCSTIIIGRRGVESAERASRKKKRRGREPGRFLVTIGINRDDNVAVGGAGIGNLAR